MNDMGRYWDELPLRVRVYRTLTPEWLTRPFQRAACRALGWHGLTCRGRSDHYTAEQCVWHPVLRKLNL